MSETLDSAVKTLSEKLGGGAIDGSIKFAIDGLGAVRIDGGEVSIDDGDADCTITADEDTFKGIVSGDMNPTTAFMTGKLKIDGDMSKAMSLSSMLA